MAMQDYLPTSIRSSAILTTGYVAATIINDNELKNQLVLLVDLTFDGSQTSATLKIEFSNDGTNYYQESYENLGTISSVTAPFNCYQIEHVFLGTGKYRVPVAIKDRFVRVSIKGAGTLTASLAKLDAITGVS